MLDLEQQVRNSTSAAKAIQGIMKAGKSPKKIKTILLVVSCLAVILGILVYRRHSQKNATFHVVTGLPTKLILAPDQFAYLNGTPKQDFDVADSGAIVLAVGDFVVALRDKAGYRSVTKWTRAAGLQSLAFDATGSLLLIGSQGIYVVQTAEGTATTATVASFQGIDSSTHLASSSANGQIYIYGGNSDYGGFRTKIVKIRSDGSQQFVVKTESAVTAVTENSNALYFATEKNEVFGIYKGDLRLIIRLPSDFSNSRIVSLAAEPEGGLYFSTTDAVYLLEGASAILVEQGLGGGLRVHNGALYLLDVPRKTLLCLGEPS